MPRPENERDETHHPNAVAQLAAQLHIEPVTGDGPPPPIHAERSRRILALGFVVALLAVIVFAGTRVIGPRHDVSASTAAPQASDVATIDASGDAVDTGVDQYRGDGWIAAENSKPGSSAWIIPDDTKMWEKVRGYADATSVNHGGRFSLYVNTAAPTFTADAYRMGYYGGSGGRLIWSSGSLPGVAQPAAVVDSSTRMAEAHWVSSIDVQTGPDWPPGMYLIKLSSSDGGASFVPMVVRDDASQAPLLIQSEVTTWQAYNGWGGANLYTGPPSNPKARAQVVSFDRPYGGNGSGEFFGREFEFAYWAEREGMDVTYWTDVDLNDRPDLAKQHRGVISLGHDEYYSTAMRDGLTQARDSGVNLAFLGANAIYRKIRLESSPLGSSRREVNYRVAKDDPLNGKQNDQVTVSWRDAPSNDPESSLLGGFYECNPVTADWVVADSSAWMFDGTGFKDGDKVPGMVGNEYDRITPEVPTPKNIQVIAHSPVTCRKAESFADSSYYTADSGAGVFDLGTFWLIPKLKTDCPEGSDNVDCKMQRFTANLMRVFGEGPAGREHPSVDNLERFGIKAGYLKNGRPPEDDDTPDPGVTSSTRAPATTTPARVPVPLDTTTTRPATTTTTTTAPTTPTTPTTAKPFEAPRGATP